MNHLAKIVVVLALAYGASVFFAVSWGGEVVVLETQDAKGTTFRTSLWVLEQSGDTWIRADRSDASWLDRLRLDPAVHLIRDDQRQAYTAQLVEGVEARVHEGMREKYGVADQLVSWLRDPDEAVVIRLVKRRPPSSWSQAYP